MNWRPCLRYGALVGLWLGAGASAAIAAARYVSIPVVITDEAGRSFDAERGLVLVPENRAVAGSRTIAVHFLRFRALDGNTARAPVFMLPGGPGFDFSFKRKWLLDLVQRMRATRDLVYVSQRGFPGAPGLVANLMFTPEPVELNRPLSLERDQGERMGRAISKAYAEWSARGVDVSGYDILNLVDDVHDLRAALGYPRIVLRGCSFGSLWSFAYLKRWPKTVEGAFLSGVFMGGDRFYDSADEIWASFGRLAKMAEADAHLAPHIPRGGLLSALQDVIRRLEQAPVTVTIADPRTRLPVEIVIGADDVRRQIVDPRSFMGKDERGNFVNWPLFIVELHRGDYRYLAARSWEHRADVKPGSMLWGLDLSLGHTQGRDEALAREPATRWLGNLNVESQAIRKVQPASVLSGDWSTGWKVDVPVLLLNGDLDWYTTIESARDAGRFLSEGRLLTVRGGSHCPEEEGELQEAMPEVLESILSFFDVDWNATAPEDFFAALPEQVSLPALRFSLPAGDSLYDRWLEDRQSRPK